MQIVVNHLTRMSKGYICVAGVDIETGAHVRPVLAHRLSEQLLRRHGGPFDIGALVDLGPVSWRGGAPELEDQAFEPRHARWIQDLPPPAFWQILERATRSGVQEIFGPALMRHRRTYAVPLHAGNASLGCVVPRHAAFEQTEYGKLRLEVADQAGSDVVSLSVTDLRLYEADHETPRWGLIHSVNARISAGVPLIVCVGLGRPYRAEGDSADMHWLQANNVHLRDNPLWQEQSIGPAMR